MLLPVSEAREKLIATLSSMDIEEIDIHHAVGRVLARALVAAVNAPPFANSGMDGFAVRSQDLMGAKEESPVSLKVVDDIPAGQPSKKKVNPGESMRIMTGAAMPEGADTVVPVEKTNFNYQEAEAPLPEQVVVAEFVEKGAYVRNQGEDFSAGAVLLPPGKRISAKEIGILASMGAARLQVYKRPLVGLLSTGDELLAVDQPLEPGKIHESNSYTLGALIKDCGADLLNLGIVKDTKQAVQDALDKAVEAGVHMLISSAGVSVGAYDYVRSVVEENGHIDFWRVNMRPGKPLAFGNYRGVPFVGLPGNPVSSFVGFEVFLRPALNHIGGSTDWDRLKFQASLEEDVSSDGRESYLRAVMKMDPSGIKVSLTGHQGSGNLFSISLANCLIIVPAGVKSLKAGERVETWPLRN